MELSSVGTDSLFQKLLTSRNMTLEELEADYGGLHDPYLLKDMDKAVERILSAIKTGEKIVVYSDFDADGIPGGALLSDFFRNIGYKNFTNYIPHRNDEGYGFHEKLIEKFKADGTALIITVDVGIVDLETVATANRLGVDVVVTDHHEPGEKLPEALAVINPKRKDCGYPFKGLSGTGVAWKLIQAILSRERFDIKTGMEKWWLDLVGLATISDMVPLRGENRILAKYGLTVLRKTRRPGLLQLYKKLRLPTRYLSEDDISFMITPRINAASRMGHPQDAFALLTAADEVSAGTYADHLNKINDERKGVVAAIVKDIKKHLEFKEPEPVIVLGNPKWQPSLLGLVANSLVEEYDRPVFLWGEESSGTLKGSCRLKDVHAVELMRNAGDVLLGCGGHECAGGFTVSRDKVHLLEEALNAAYAKLKTDAKQKEAATFDAELSLSDVSWQMYKSIEKLAPFGMDNPKPIFLFKKVLLKNVRKFGKQGNHLEISFENSPVRAIGFFMNPEQFGRPLASGVEVNLVAHVEKSVFRNVPELRLRIVDMM